MATMEEMFINQQHLNHVFRTHWTHRCLVCGVQLEDGKLCDACCAKTANETRLALTENYKRFCGCENCHGADVPVRSLKLYRNGHLVHETQIPTTHQAFWHALEDTKCLCPMCAWRLQNPDDEELCIPPPVCRGTKETE